MAAEDTFRIVKLEQRFRVLEGIVLRQAHLIELLHAQTAAHETLLTHHINEDIGEKLTRPPSFPSKRSATMPAPRLKS